VGLTNVVALQSVSSGGTTTVTDHATDMAGAELFEFDATMQVPVFIGRDAHGDTTWTAGVTGSVSITGSYDPFGNLVASTGSVPSWRWQGSWQDSVTGLYYVVALWYAPTLGTFLAPDPIAGSTADPQSRDPYGYGAGDPIDRMDPSGMSVNLGAVANWAQRYAYQAFWNDWANGYGIWDGECTDFVSQALMVGGKPENPPSYLSYLMYLAQLPFIGADEYAAAIALNHAYKTNLWYWYFLAPGVASNSWGGALCLFDNLTSYGNGTLITKSWYLDEPYSRRGSYPIPSGVQRGDIIFCNWSGSSPYGIDHAGVIVQVERGDLEIAQHQRNTIDGLWNWQQGGSSTHVWIVQPR
jgi:RHS repeat-associated protein